MRFTLFELFAWITFLAACCAIFVRGHPKQLEQGVLLVAWAAVAIVSLKLWNRRVALCVAVLIGVGLGIYAGVQVAVVSNMPPRISKEAAAIVCAAWFGVIGAIIWGIVDLTDKVICFVMNRVNPMPSSREF